MFQQEKLWYKKCFANNKNDSRINEMLYSVKLEVEELMAKESLDFIFLLSRGKGKYQQTNADKKFETYLSPII